METPRQDNYSVVRFPSGISFDTEKWLQIDESARAFLAEKITEITSLLSEGEKKAPHIDDLTEEVAASVVDVMVYDGVPDKKIRKFLKSVAKKIQGKFEHPKEAKKIDTKIEKKLSANIPNDTYNLYFIYPDGTAEQIPFLIHKWSDVGSTIHSFRIRKNFEKFLKKS